MAAPSPIKVDSVDNIVNVNAFLAAFGASRVTEAQYEVPSTPLQDSQLSPADISGAPSEHVSETGRETHGITSNVTSVAASPQTGSCAPPCTPASLRAAAAANTTQLDPVPENHASVLVALAEQSNQNLMDSKHAFSRQEGVLFAKTRAALCNKSPNITSIKRQPVPESQEKLVETMKNTNFQDTVLKTFRQQSGNMNTPTAGTSEEVVPKMKLSKVEGATGSEDEEAASRSSDTVPFPALEEQSPARPTSISQDEPAAANSTPARSTQKLKDLLAEEAVKSQVVEKSNEQTQTPVANVGGTNTPTVVATPRQSPEAEEPEDREHLTHFKSWGPVAPRSTPKARPRKIILTGLPMTADNTLLASLLHGGTIEAFRIFTASDTSLTKNATVLFADADAAQKYYEQHPNGIKFKYGNRRCAATVEIGQEVDVLSSLVRGHLEAGASRVVRATGADEDWGMRALCRLAEGKGRRIEGITDYWRDDIRTIVFRFTNIPDAVQFRGQLMRDYEWEMCNIQFMDDPCAKATGVHMES